MKNQTHYPLISIIIVNFNGKEYLEETLSALQKLTYPCIELIVVDNGSTDGSIEYLSKNDSINVIKSPILGAKNHAGNLGAQKAQGEYLLFLDNDMVITDRNILYKLVSMYTEGTGYIALSFINDGEKKTKIYGNIFGYCFNKEKTPLSSKQLHKMNGSLVSCANGSFFIQSTKWHQIGGYDEFFTFGGDDSDVGIRMWQMGYRNILFSETLQTHIGMAERTDTKKYANKWRQVCFAHMVVIFKDYALGNMLVTLPCYTFLSLLKSIKQSLFRRDIRPLISYVQACIRFIIKVPQILQKRRETQKNRVVKEDTFLNVS